MVFMTKNPVETMKEENDMININESKDVSQFEACLRGRSKGEFSVKNEISQLVFDSIKKFAAENKVSIEVCKPSNERIVLFSVAGAAAGGGLGYLFGGLPGVFVGLGLGTIAGYATAQISITWQPLGDETYVTIQ